MKNEINNKRKDKLHGTKPIYCEQNNNYISAVGKVTHSNLNIPKRLEFWRMLRETDKR